MPVRACVLAAALHQSTGCARGIPLALGIDQSNIADDRDMTLEMKLVWALHRETGLFNDRPGAAEVIAMATEGGARDQLHRFL